MMQFSCEYPMYAMCQNDETEHMQNNNGAEVGIRTLESLRTGS